jgi:phosphoglycerate dehydrogenase-like enzyme
MVRPVNVLLHYNAGPRLRAVLDEESTDGVRVSWTPEGDDDAWFRAMATAETLLHVLEPVTAEAMDAAPNLQLIQKLGVGVNTIDLDAARARGIAVANLPGSNAIAVAEHTLGLLLAVRRRVPAFDREVRAGTGWPLAAEIPDGLGEVAGRVVGLVGYGAIAQRFGSYVAAMGATVVHHRRSEGPDSVSLDELLGVADVVSVHLPLTDETRNLLDARRLGLMRPGAVLLNTGRGGVVDERALADLLRTGHLAGAGIDVFEQEPIDIATNPLVGLDNVVLSPHVAWLTADTLARSIRLGVANARLVARGQEPEHRVA